MRKISAHYIINPGKEPIKNGILELADDGTILKLRSTDQIQEEDHLEFYSGVLVPGFVNVHCHLELSHLKDQIEPESGISSFVDQVVTKREEGKSNTHLFQSLLFKMFHEGTQALGDISNSNESLLSKINSPVQIHTFIEVFGLNIKHADAIWENGIKLLNDFRQAGLSASMTPHAPYSISIPLWEHFRDKRSELVSTLSMHNQESKEEQDLIKHQSGPFAELFSSIGIATKDFPGPANSSPEWYQKLLPPFRKLLLIHNTFTTEEDIQFLLNNNQEEEIYFGLCPISNLFIENKLPQTIIKNRKQVNLCIGTDSLASNYQLSVWDEIKTLAKEYPEISLVEFVEMASLNGARALGIDTQIGSFEPGKKPGVVLLEGIDLEALRIPDRSRSRRIL